MKAGFLSIVYPSIFLIIISLSFFSESCVNKDSKEASDSIRSKIISEFSALNSYYNRTYVLQFTDSVTRAHPPKTILINLNKIITSITGLPDDQQTILIRLIIAHEFIHLLQYRNSLSYSTGEAYRSRMIEAQADILAAHYTISKYGRENLSKEESITIERYKEEKFINAYKLFFSFGYPVNSLVDHPTRYQRASCIYRGIRSGRIDILMMELRKAQQKKNAKRDLAYLDSLIKSEREALNFNGEYNLFEWSWEQAKLICHGDPANLANFVRLNSRIDTLRNRRKQMQGMVVSQYFANDSYKDLDVTMELRAAPLRKSSTPFFDNIEFEQARYHTYHFIPHEMFYFVDKFKIPSDKRLFEVITPPDTNSLYFVETSRKNASTPLNETTKYALDSTLEQLTFKEYLFKINKAINDKNISSIVASSGMESRNPSDAFSLYFTGVVPITEKFSSIVSYDGRLYKQYSVKLIFEETKDSLLAFKKFSFWKERISSILVRQPNRPEVSENVKWDYKDVISFKSKKYLNNLNYLFIERVDNFLRRPLHPFNVINGDYSQSFEKPYYDTTFQVYMIIRQPIDPSKERPFPKKFKYPRIYEDY